jgi:general secretion pathway protein J
MPAHISTNRHQTGFTLLEILVAVSIFSIMSVVALTGIKVILDSQEATNRVAVQIKSLQNTFFYFDQDLRYAIARDIRDEFGDTQAAMVADNAGPQGLALTRMGIGNLQGSKRSSMARVRYWLKEDTLIRSRYKTLDRAGEPQSLDRALMENVEELEFRFLGANKEWQPSWPPLNPTANQGALPRAIEINLTHEQMGKITRIIPLHGF